MLSLQHRAYCSLISCSPCEFASTDGRIGSLEANTACILLTLSGGKGFINWDAFSLSLSLCLLPKHIIAVNKRAESECMCDLDVVMVYFPRLETLPASSSSSLVLFFSPHNRRGSNFSRCHSAEAAPLAGCPPGNFFSCKLQMFLLLWQWVDSRLRKRNCRVWRIQRPLHFSVRLTARTSADKTSGWLENAWSLCDFTLRARQMLSHNHKANRKAECFGFIRPDIC